MGKGALNPADKARKEARKKELKKNKKQRQQVRSAVIESRNPEQILADLEQLDRREYDAEQLRHQQQLQQPSSTTSQPVNTDLLYMEKRKRLKELYAKCVAHYEKEDPERHASLKSLEVNYEAKHKKLKRDFEAVRAAAEINIGEVFLPPEPTEAMPAADDPIKQQMLPPPHLVMNNPNLRPPHQHQINLRQSFQGHQHAGRPAGAHQRPRFVPSQARTRPAPPHQGRPTEGGVPAPSSRPTAGSGPPSSTAPIRPREPPRVAAAVIESKPVIFMPKATKFVPASVRSKAARPSASAPDKS